VNPRSAPVAAQGTPESVYCGVPTMASQRRLNACLTAAALALALAQAVAGGAEVLLAAAPLLLLAGLLLCGRYVGEERIVARLARHGAGRPARRRVARWRPAVDHEPISLLARAARLERGPPAPALLPTAA
jgi:hypothetical protein